MHRAQLLKRLDTAWEAFRSTYTGRSESELIEPGVRGAWSVRDILAHVTTWEEEALKYLPLILAGGKPPRYSMTYGGIDAFNVRMTEEKRGLPARHASAGACASTRTTPRGSGAGGSGEHDDHPRTPSRGRPGDFFCRLSTRRI